MTNKTNNEQESVGIEVIPVDYHNPQHRSDLIAMLDHYARDPMGGGQPLNEYACSRLADAMADMPGGFSLLAYDDKRALGLTNCFTTLSTFTARPIINIHDIVVRKNVRGRGIARAMFKEVENIAKMRGAAKVTLEVLAGNDRAKILYNNLGYNAPPHNIVPGDTLFYQKEI